MEGVDFFIAEGWWGRYFLLVCTNFEVRPHFPRRIPRQRVETRLTHGRLRRRALAATLAGRPLERVAVCITRAFIIEFHVERISHLVNDVRPP